MFKLISLLSLIGVALGAGFGERGHTYDVTTSRPGITDSGLIDCTTLENGSHNVHPTDCTRFVQCDNNRAQDMPCAACGGTPGQCLGREWLEFDGSAPSCVWPVDSTCRNGPTPTTPVTSPTTTTTQKPTTKPTTTTEGQQPTTKPTTTTDGQQPTTTTDGQQPTTTTDGQQPTTTTEGQQPTTPAPGAGCDATNCTIALTCRDYTFCERIDQTQDPDLVSEGQLVTVTCDAGLWPVGSPTENSNGDNVVGACLPWTEVPAERKEEILRLCTEPECELLLVNGPCTNQFQYRNNDRVVSAVNTCPGGRIVDIAKRGCVEGSCK